MSDAVLRDLIEDLAQDTSSGAAELASRATAVLVTLAERSEATSVASFVQQVAETGRLLVQSQPSMAPLFNLVNSVLWSLENARDVAEARRKVREETQGFADKLVSRGESIASEALTLISPGSRLFTHSRSSTVLGALLYARSTGRDFQVVCTESRPLYEGRTLAGELSRADISTTLVTDAAIGLFMEGADLVMVGADTVSSRGLVNKIGTHGLALAARAHGVPFYALCGTEKFSPSDCSHFEIEWHDPEEVWPGHPPEVTVVNCYFDVTPLDYVTGLVTETGLLGLDELEERLGELRVHQTLL